MMQFTSTPNSNPKRARTIILATVVAVAILAIGVWAIISAINSVSHRTTGGTIVASDSQPGTSQAADAPKTDTKDDAKDSSQDTQSSTSGSAPASPSSQYAPTQSGNASAQSAPQTAPTTTVDQVPSTGPEDMISTALLVGVAVYLVALSRNYAKEEATLLAK